MSSKLLPVAAAVLASVVQVAHAGLNVGQLKHFNPATGTNTDYTPLPVGSGDRIRALYFNSAIAGDHAVMSLPLTAQLSGQYVRFKLRAPFGNKVAIRVTDSNNVVQEYPLERGPLPVDDLGWTVLTQHLDKSPFSGTVKAIALVVYKDSQKPVGTAYVRGVQLLSTAPASTDAVVTQPAVEIGTPQFSSQLGTSGGSVQSAAGFNGDDVHPLPFDFDPAPPPTAAYVSLDMLPQPAVSGSYVRFKMRLPAGVRVGLRVVDDKLETHQYAVDRSYATPDKQGWTTHTVRLGETTPVWDGDKNKQIDGPIRKLSFLVNDTNGATKEGTAYFKEIEVLDHAPSALEPLLPLARLTTGSPNAGGNCAQFPPSQSTPGNSVKQTALAGGDYQRTMVYDFGPCNLLSMYMSAAVPAPADKKVLRFLGRIPMGLIATLRIANAAGVTSDSRLIAPLNTATDGAWEGKWVQYAVKLNTTDVAKMEFLLTSDGKSGMVNISKSGEASFKDFIVENDEQVTDLGPATSTLTGMRPRNTDPVPVTGVATRLNAPSDIQQLYQDIDRAYNTGFRRIRFDMSWNNIEKVTGVYTFSDYEAGLDRLFSKQMGAVAILAYNNNNYAEKFETTDHRGLFSDELRAKFAQYAGATAQYIKNRYPTQVNKVVFEIWNEPNSHGFWAPTANASDYTKALKLATASIKAVSPEFRVMSGGTLQLPGTVQNDTNFIEQIRGYQGFDADINNAAFVVDGIGIHPYDNGMPERQATEYMGYTNFLSGKGLKTRLWASEVGSSSGTQKEENTGLDPANRFRQAQMFVRSILTSWSLGTPMHIAFSLKDSDAFGDFIEKNYGLYDTAGAPKSAQKAVQTLFQAVKSRTYEGMVTGNPTAVQAMKFSAPGKEVVYAVWANSGGATPYQVSAFKGCSPSLALDGTPTTNSPCVVDVLGAGLNCSDIAGNANSRMVCTVSEVGGPIFIRMNAAY